MGSARPAFDRLEARARELGFDQIGCAPAAALPEELSHFQQWLADGRHGTMEWLARDPTRRADPRTVIEGCRTVVMLTMTYLRPPSDEEPRRDFHGRLSKYARTRDYHRVIEKRLRQLCRFLDAEVSPGAHSRGMVDYGPVLERPWAARAGLGFIGKHTLLIDPQEGSFFFLAAILTTAELSGPERAPISDGCGDCSRCIDACPTGAITAPYQLDARRCLSYLTIEADGPTDAALHARNEGWVFGCDICQDVCPYNRKRGRAVEESPLGPLFFPAQVPLRKILDDAEGLIASAGASATPLKRAGAESLRRNALHALPAGEQWPADVRAAVEALQNDTAQPEWLRGLAAAKLLEQEPAD